MIVLKLHTHNLNLILYSLKNNHTSTFNNITKCVLTWKQKYLKCLHLLMHLKYLKNAKSNFKKFSVLTECLKTFSRKVCF